jgi:phosphomannomutase/phosphoglucomutase
MVFILASTGQTLSQLIEGIPKRSIIKDKIKTSLGPQVLESLKVKYSDDKLDLTDGVKIIRDNSWALVRASGTEPIIRIIVDADTHECGKIFHQELMSHISKITENTQ